MTPTEKLLAAVKAVQAANRQAQLRQEKDRRLIKAPLVSK